MSMSPLVQIKSVPEGVHRTLKARAALRGQTLSDYLRGELERLAARPTPDELLAMLDRDAPAGLGDSSAAEVRRGRERSA
jgi:plasmid stability protein